MTVSNSAMTLSFPVPQQLARRCARALAVLERRLAVHEDPAIALGALHAAPLAGGEIVRDLVLVLGRQAELREIVDDDVRGRALAERAAIAEARRLRGECAHVPVSLLERQLFRVAHEPTEHVRR